MTSLKSVTAGLCIIIFSAALLLPKSALADGDQDRPIRLYATALTGPIGTVVDSALASGALTINGRTAIGGESVWEGDLLSSQFDASLFVIVDKVGKVKLTKGATVRLATSSTLGEDNLNRRALIASLLEGDIDVKLEQDACAYVQSHGGRWAASAGADFRVSARAGLASASAKAGMLSALAQSTKYNILSVGHGSDIKVRAGTVQQIRVLVTDERDRPIPEMPVSFTLAATPGERLGRIGLGTLAGSNINTLTNSEGIASVPFTAGYVEGSTTITAVVEATGATWTGTISVVPGPRTGRTALWVAGVAAAIGVGIAIVALTDDKDPITPAPPVSRP